ncbi:MAG TPA: prolyl oligopeptidase family serine peptidase, partial [Burkholderiaceae bacterium]|nr:prolyl oligopeptidase family serine peptidase [Burkholderiaceae bacterium]
VAQGYIVVAPNYAGYDTSTLPYHAEHIAAQNGQDMINALTAARKAFSNLNTPVVENGKLFLSGYSEGGYVTMATHRAMQAAGMTVTASAPQSGEYAVSTEWEALGQPGALDDLSGASGAEGGLGILFQFTAYQKTYGNLYANPSDFYSTTLAGSLETLLPTKLNPNNLVALGLFPKYLLGNDMPNYASLTPLEQSFYGPPAQSLLKTSAVLALKADIAANPCPVTSATAPLNCTPTNPVRQAGLKNDLRTWTPTQPMLMCGGHGDPEVAFINAQLAQAYFQAHGTTVALLDVDSPITANDPYADAKNAFLATKLNIIANDGDPTTQDNYHGGMAFAGCNVAVRDFFSKF